MTIDELKTCTQPFVNAADIAPILGVDAGYIRSQAQDDPKKLGFPVCCLNRRVKIPTASFRKWLGIE